MIVEDEASDPAVAVDKARKLIQQDEVAFIVGTLISAVRNAVVEVTAAAKMPLFNPTYYEGGLCQEYFLRRGRCRTSRSNRSSPGSTRTSARASTSSDRTMRGREARSLS